MFCYVRVRRGPAGARPVPSLHRLFHSLCRVAFTVSSSHLKADSPVKNSSFIPREEEEREDMTHSLLSFRALHLRETAARAQPHARASLVISPPGHTQTHRHTHTCAVRRASLQLSLWTHNPSSLQKTWTSLSMKCVLYCVFLLWITLHTRVCASPQGIPLAVWVHFNISNIRCFILFVLFISCNYCWQRITLTRCNFVSNVFAVRHN